SYYTPTQVTTIISVAHRSVVLAVSSSPTTPNVNQQVLWDVQAYDLLNSVPVKSLSVSQYINGTLEPTNTTDSTGTTIFKYTFAQAGWYNVTFVSAMNATFSSET